jgi:hypothetical protein
VPKVVLNTARVPLSSFIGVNLSNVRSVQFQFDQVPSGALLISDIAFAGSSVQVPAPPPLLKVPSGAATTLQATPAHRGPRPAHTRVITPGAPSGVEPAGAPSAPNQPPGR